VTASDSGGDSSVAAMIAASSTVLGRPLRTSSSSQAIPLAANRFRHLITVGRDTPKVRAACEVPAPSATANTIRARSTRPADIVDDRVHDSKVSRSAVLISSADNGIHHHPTL
jgi:hypothetical protein